MHFPTRFLDILAICTLCDDDYTDTVESAGALHKVYWRAYMYHTEMNTITMSTVDSTTDSWQRCTRDSNTRDSYTRNNSRVCWQQCTDAVNVLCTFTEGLLYTCTVAIHNIDATCRKNRWNLIVKTRFCQIFDNLRHVSAWNTILLKHHCQNDVWNDLRHLTV